jgi:hypothetical protein
MHTMTLDKGWPDTDPTEHTLTRREAQFKHLVRFSLLSYGPIAPIAIVAYASGANY